MTTANVISGFDLKAGDKIVVNGRKIIVESIESDDPDDFRFLQQDPALVAAEAILVRQVESSVYYHLWRGESYETWA